MQISDESLVALAREGDRVAQDELLQRYKNLVRSLARMHFLTGGETEDLVQEGMCGLYSAICNYKEGVSSFSAYARKCIKNRIIDAIKLNNGDKYSALNFSLPLSDVPQRAFNPEDEIIAGESYEEALSKIRSHLSALEYKAFKMYIDGASMAEISKSVKKTVKCAFNAVARAKRKIQKLYMAED